MTPAGRGQRCEQLGIDDWTWPRQRHGRVLDGGGPLAQPGGKHLLELDQRADRCLCETSNGVACGAAQADDHGDGLVVVKQQRRQRAAWTEPVSAGDAGHRMHWVVQVAQALHVAAQGPDSDAQPVRELGARPLGPDLQQPEQPEQPRRCLQHQCEYPAY
jgi:hypothetical protein